MASFSSSSSLLASHTVTNLISPITKPLFFNPPKPLFFNSPKPKSISFVSPQNRPIYLHKIPTILASSSTPTKTRPLLTESTRTLTTLLAVAFAASKAFAYKIANLSLQLKGFHGLQQSLGYTVGPAFFAAAKSDTTRYLNTPLTVVAAGLAKWLDIYSGVLLVRVLLSWFPNIPWDRQPLSAIRDLCDPYLNLFRNIIPPIFDTLDISPLMAFAVLGGLGSILNSSRGAY